MKPCLQFSLNGVRYAADATPVLEIDRLPELTLNWQAKELGELERFNCATMGRDLDRIVLEHFNKVSHRPGQAPPCMMALLDVSAGRPKRSEVQ